MIRTTVIGTQPRPSQIFVRDLARNLNGVDLQEDQDASPEAIAKENALMQGIMGLDVYSEGEVFRSGYCYQSYFLKFQDGVIDNDPTAAQSSKAVSPISWTGPSVALDWKLAQSVSDKPVKINLPGPLTVAWGLPEGYYPPPSESPAYAEAVAACLADEVKSLVEMGCKYIQFDDPHLTWHPIEAKDHGIRLLGEIVADLPDDVTTVVHMCRGNSYTFTQPVDSYVGQEMPYYWDIHEELAKTNISIISIEDPKCSDGSLRLDAYAEAGKQVMLGITDVRRRSIQTAIDMAPMLARALLDVAPDKLWLSPACGMLHLSPQTAIEKMREVKALADRANQSMDLMQSFSSLVKDEITTQATRFEDKAAALKADMSAMDTEKNTTTHRLQSELDAVKAELAESEKRREDLSEKYNDLFVKNLKAELGEG